VSSARVVASVVALGVVLCARADAAPPSDPMASLSFVASPIFGADAATGSGWNEVVARIDNTGETAQRGVLELTMTQTWSSSDPEVAARAPFAVPAGHSAIVAIPTHSFSYYAPQMTIAAKTEQGRTIQSVTVAFNGSTAPLLVEVEETARLSHALRGWPIDSKWVSGPTPVGNNALTVGAPGFDHATGDPILPEHASGYAAATVVLIRSNRLVALDEAKRDALVGWVNAGGTLAVVPARPEDLRSPVMTSLIGGTATAALSPARLLLLPAFEKPAGATLGPGLAPPSATKSKKGAHSEEEEEARVVSIGPSSDVREHLSGYAGGDLRPSDYGASASCGLGEVHLLAFDPTSPQAAEDPWVDTRIVGLVAHAWDRRALVALPLGGGERGVGRVDAVRRALDPNESFRVGLGVSSLILVLYSIVVGPLVFARAAKRGTALSPLVWVPACSAAAFAAIVVVGLAEKGWRGRSRHLTLLEAGSSSSHAAMRSYRGFFASETQSLSVTPLQRASVLEVASTEGIMQRTSYGALRVDRDGVTLGDLTSLPWQTVVVREDGLADLKEGIALVPAASGGLDVVNGSGHALKDVLVHGVHDAAYFPTIADGARVSLSSGRPVFSLGGTATVSGTLRVHQLGTSAFTSVLGPDGKRVAAGWAPFEAAAGDAIDWWSDDTPVLIAELVSPSHAPSDSGLALESDRVFVRIVGTPEAKP
jgi:hypothetical protein